MQQIFIACLVQNPYYEHPAMQFCKKYSYLTETTETTITKIRMMAPNTEPTIIRMSSVSGGKNSKQEICQLITLSEY